ncbi:MAG: hypothetical protein IRZ11_07480 [Clostridia bacterium]|nr:hypothetical protein [Clostridia bacterium]
MQTIECQECGQTVTVPEGAWDGRPFECPNCAGVWFRLVRDEEGVASARRVWRASCPVCGCDREVPEDARPGDRLVCCGRPWRLSFEYGSWALEEG